MRSTSDNDEEDPGRPKKVIDLEKLATMLADVL